MAKTGGVSGADVSRMYSGLPRNTAASSENGIPAAIRSPQVCSPAASGSRPRKVR